MVSTYEKVVPVPEEILALEIVNVLSQGISENIVIMGITDYDFRVNDKIPLLCRELAQKIMEPNGIKIVF